MFSIKRTILLSFFCAAVCRGEVWIELVPSPPPPHFLGQVVTLDVYAHSEVATDQYIWGVQLDFTDSNSAILLDPIFDFDLSSSSRPQDFTVSPALPVPLATNFFEYMCDPCRLQLPAQGVLHVGSVSLQLPSTLGIYRVDTLNADESEINLGAYLPTNSFEWRAYTGEITGGTYDFFVGLEQGVPALSGWGAIVMVAALVGIGSFILRTRQRGSRSVSGCASFLAVLIFGFGSPVIAQPATSPSEIVEVSIDSGLLSIGPESVGNAPLWSHVVSYADAPWMRLHFKQAELGDVSVDGKSSYLRLTSLADGDVQVLDAMALEQWGYTSGYFLGDQVLLEVLAQPGAGESRIVVDQMIVGATTTGLESLLTICPPDDRVPSMDARASRLRYILSGLDANGTAFLFDGRSNSLLTAGHNCDFMDWTASFKPIVEFNVWWSNSDGSIIPADLDDQYPVDRLSIQCQNGDCSTADTGDDWCYFGVWRNAGTTLCPLQAQGSSYTLAPTVPAANGSPLRVTGFGNDIENPISHRAQQTATGPFRSHSGTTVAHEVDTEPGSSGSAVEHVSSSLVYAIHTHGRCAFGGNKGTAVDHPGLQAALAAPKGVCKDCDGDGIPNGCESTGACCMSYSPNDCRYITDCECAAEGIWWYGETGNCSQINCFLAPSGPQQAP